MKIALLGDTHFGVRNDARHFHEYYEKFYSEVFFPYLEEHGINTIIQLGDLFDRRKYINFLSLAESFGFPLVEAMWIGLPIICPDLPYARTLCGEQAIYFDPNNVDSLHVAIGQLTKRRNLGWWPDWSINLKKIPRDWEKVADAMLLLATT